MLFYCVLEFVIRWKGKGLEGLKNKIVFLSFFKQGKEKNEREGEGKVKE